MADVFFRFCPVCGTAYDEPMKNVWHKECRNCGYTFYENQAATVGAILRHNGKILLVKRAVEPAKGKWDIPGGFVEPDETTEAAIIREVKEETGLQANITKILGTFGPTWYEFKGRGQYNTDIFYEMESSSADFLAADDAEECKWFAPDELPQDEELAFPSIPVVLKEFRHAETARKA